MLLTSRLLTVIISLAILFTLLVNLRLSNSWNRRPNQAGNAHISQHTNDFDWSQRPQKYPTGKLHPLPRPAKSRLPRVQFDFSTHRESAAEAATREQRLDQVKGALKRSWKAYRRKAWMQDELTPLTGGSKTPFGGWAATLVDALDTLWIAGLRDEFNEAVEAAMSIDFSKSAMREINVFETTIRYLGGFIAAFDLSGDERLLEKALELGNMLYASFDTPNRLPVLRWNFNHAKHHEQTASKPVLLAEIGSLSMEFTRLSQTTGDPKWYDAIHRIMVLFAAEQHKTSLPGLWPIEVNAEDADFHTGDRYSLGAWADSMYEYLPKMYALLGGSDQYANMWKSAADTASKNLLYRPMTKENVDVLVAGVAKVDGNEISLKPELEHLVCFAGGMFALGGRLLQNESHVDIGRKLTHGCMWAYSKFETGIMPEVASLMPCTKDEPCRWDEAKWHEAVLQDAPSKKHGEAGSAEEVVKSRKLPPGFASIKNTGYYLRPEAIESVFILYRITGDKALQDTAWDKFTSVALHTKTPLAYAALTDVTNITSPQEDSMESFW